MVISSSININETNNMSKPRKSPTANENWVKQETKDEYKKVAEKKLAECKKYESEHKFRYEKISDMPKTFKRVKI